MADEQASSERYLKMSDLRKQAEKRYPLWEFFAEENNLTLTEGELDDIIHAVKKHLANDLNEDARGVSELKHLVRADEYDLVAHLHRQREFSKEAFGPGQRTKGVLDHIRKELHEIEEEPKDIEEWIDLVLLALDGAWRAGNEPEEIAEALKYKQAKNENRDWPDWRDADPDKAIEHL